MSDTWDFWQVITEYASALKAEILARAPNALGQAKVVFRPDSGDPVKILTGYLPDELAGDADADGMYTVRTRAARSPRPSARAPWNACGTSSAAT